MAIRTYVGQAIDEHLTAHAALEQNPGEKTGGEREEYLNVQEVAALLKKRPQTIYNWVSQGRIAPRRTPAGGLLFERKEIETLTKQST
jgi:predicted DNA-binding transcriptional regulator AlpA